MVRGLASILGAATLALVLVACTGNGDDDSFDAGPIEDFPNGSITTFADGEIIERTTPTESISRDVPFGGEVIFHLVRTESGEFLALSARDPHSACWVPWTREHEFDERTGWFFDFCHGNTFDLTGMLAFGPGPRDLDRYPTEVRDGHVYVALADDARILGETRVEFIDPDASPTPDASPEPTVAIIDWVDFVQFGGVGYLRTAASLDNDHLGPLFDTVRFRTSGNVTDPLYRASDGDAAFLDEGTPVFTVRGYARAFRLAVNRDGQLTLYEADVNTAATHGADLLDIGGKVTAIGIYSPVDGTTQLGTIDDPGEVATLVDLVLDAPVDQTEGITGSARYFIAFHLEDGTEVLRSYWRESGMLQRGIMLPAAFGTMVDRALDAPGTTSPATADVRGAEPMTIRIPTDDQVDLGDVTIDAILLGRIAVFADGALCGSFAAGAGSRVGIGTSDQPAVCHREGAVLDLVDGAGRRLVQTFTFAGGTERAFENFAPIPPHTVYPDYICDYLDAEGIERVECEVGGGS